MCLQWFLNEKECSFYSYLLLKWGLFISSTAIWVTGSDARSVASRGRTELISSKYIHARSSIWKLKNIPKQDASLQERDCSLNLLSFYQTNKQNSKTNKQTNLIDDVERKQTQCIVFLHFPWSTKFVECALGHPREHVNERVQPVLLVLLRERNHLQTKRQKGSIKEPIHQKHLTWKKKEPQCQFEIYLICNTCITFEKIIWISL